MKKNLVICISARQTNYCFKAQYCTQSTEPGLESNSLDCLCDISSWWISVTFGEIPALDPSAEENLHLRNVKEALHYFLYSISSLKI